MIIGSELVVQEHGCVKNLSAENFRIRGHLSIGTVEDDDRVEGDDHLAPIGSPLCRDEVRVTEANVRALGRNVEGHALVASLNLAVARAPIVRSDVSVVASLILFSDAVTTEGQTLAS